LHEKPAICIDQDGRGAFSQAHLLFRQPKPAIALALIDDLTEDVLSSLSDAQVPSTERACRMTNALQQGVTRSGVAEAYKRPVL
jgi:hypothetical protein